MKKAIKFTRENSYLVEYYEDIRDGKIIAGIELIKQLEALVNDLREIEEGVSKFSYDVTRAHSMIDFIENVIPITKSEGFGDTMELFLWQKAFIEAAYSFVYNYDTTVERFKRIILLVSKKNGKSALCSAMGTAELAIGPRGQLIIFGSNDYRQAGLIYDTVIDMASQIDPTRDVLRKNQSEVRNQLTLSKGIKLSSKSEHKDGYDIDTAYIDEYHEAKDNELLKMIEMGMSVKKSPKLFVVTTEGFNQEGALSELLKEARKILNGEDDSELGERTLSFLYTQDSIDEVFGPDEIMWYKSSPSLGETKRFEYVREQVGQARKSPSERSFVLTKEFNIPQNTSSSWLNYEEYDYELEPWELSEFRGARAIVGVDLSQTTDLSAISLLLMRENDDTKYVYNMGFIPSSKIEESPDLKSGAKYEEWAREGRLIIHEGNEIDLRKIAIYIYEEFYKKHKITPIMIGYDVRFASEFIKTLDEIGFPHELVNQNGRTLGNAIRLLELDIKSRKLNFNSDEVTKWTLGNAGIKVDSFGNPMVIKKGNVPANRIDIVDSMVVAYEIYRRYKSELSLGLGREKGG